MRMGKRIIYSICFLIILFAGSRVRTVLAADYTYTDENNVTYEYTDTGVLKSVTGAVGLVDLAEMAETKNITIKSIGTQVFGTDNYVTSVNLPASVQVIEQYAFSSCEYLSEVTYEEDSKLTTIGAYAFAYDAALKDFHLSGSDKNGTLSLPDGVSVIGESAFEGTGFRKVVIPKGVNRIEDVVFSGCESLSEVEFSDNITSIGDMAFGSTSLSSVKIPDKVTVIGEEAFAYVSTLREIIFPTETPFIIKESAFAFTGLLKITLPANCTQVGEKAFYNYESDLSEVKIQNASMVIGGNAFPDTVTIYGKEGSTAQKYAKDNSLSFCQLAEDDSGQEEGKDGVEQKPSSDEEKTTEDDTNPETPSDNNNGIQPGTPPGGSNQLDKQPSDTSAQPVDTVVKLKVGKKYTIQGLIYKANSESSVVFVKPKKKTITKLVVPGFVTVEGSRFPVAGVAAKACYKFKNLKKITIGNNVSSIGAQAFQECKKLKEVTLGKGLTKIGSKCFYKDVKLKKVVIKSKKLKLVGKKSMRGTPKKEYCVPKGYKTKYKRLLKKGK